MSLFVRFTFLFSLIVFLSETESLRAGGPKFAVDKYGDPLPPRAIGRLGTIRLTHAGPVVAAVISPDGKMIASVGRDDALRIWDAATGKELARKLEKRPTAVLFSPEGKYLASATHDGVKLWHPKSWKRLRGFPVGSESPGAMVFSTDSNLLAIWCESGVAIVCNTQTGHELLRLPKGAASGPLNLAFSSNGEFLAVGGADGNIRLWNVQTGREKLHVNTGKNDLNFVSIPSPGDLLFFQPYGKQIYRYDLKRGGEPKPLEYKSLRRAMAFSPDGRTRVLPGGSGEIELCDLVSGKTVAELSGVPFTQLNSTNISADGSTVVAGYADGSVRLWNVRTRTEKLKFFRTPPVSELMFADNGHTLILACNRSLQIWDLRDRTLRRQIPSSVNIPAFSRDGAFSIRKYDIADGYEIERLDLSPAGRSHKISIKGKSFSGVDVLGTRGDVAVCVDRTIYILDPRTAKRRAVVKLTKEIECFAAAPDGRTIASVGLKNAGYWLCIWDQASGKLLREIDLAIQPDEQISQITFAPDAKSLFVWCPARDIVHQWGVRTGRTVRDFPGMGFRGFAVSADCGIIAVPGLSDKSHEIELIEVATGTRLETLTGSGQSTYPLAFSPDGRLLACASGDGSVLIWEVFPASLVAPKKWGPAEKGKVWDDLASGKGEVVYAALRQLISRQEEAVVFLETKLQRRKPVPSEQLQRWLDDLGSSSLSTRDKAQNQLREIDGEAEAPLGKLLASNPTLEVSRRLDQLLAELRPHDIRPETLRRQRCVLALEHINVRAAHRLLEKLSQGATGAYLTEDSRAALARLLLHTKYQ